MNLSRADLIRLLHRLGRNLLHDAWYPTLAIGLAQAMVSPEAGLHDCLATASVLLAFIATAALFCFAVAWGISLGSDD